MSSSSSMSASGGGGGNRRRGVFSLGRYRLPGSASSGGSSTRLSQQLVQQHQQPSQHQQHLVDSGAASSKAVKYTPRGQDSSASSLLHHGHGHDDELEEIAVVSAVQSGQLTYGAAGSSLANGPRVVPGRTFTYFHYIFNAKYCIHYEMTS